jgi:hypothetical protein
MLQCTWQLAPPPLLLLLQRTKGSFPNVLFKVPAHDHTACKDGQRLELDQCVPAGKGALHFDLI